jgi:hypothetical protein
MSHGEIRKNWVKEGLIASGCGMLYGKLMFHSFKFIFMHFIYKLGVTNVAVGHVSLQTLRLELILYYLYYLAI